MRAPAIRLILASASPARRATLISAGIEPTVIVSDVDEDQYVADVQAQRGRLPASEVALTLAQAKCEAVASGSHDALVLGCDSVLELDGEVHGKPGTAEVAIARWRQMRGRSGVLHTGHWLADTRMPSTAPTALHRDRAVGATASTVVQFADLDDDEIEAYVATGEPLRVAGAFTIDGLGGAFVTRIEGDPHTVVGLSLPLLRTLLRDLGVGWFDVSTPRG